MMGFLQNLVQNYGGGQVPPGILSQQIDAVPQGMGQGLLGRIDAVPQIGATPERGFSDDQMRAFQQMGQMGQSMVQASQPAPMQLAPMSQQSRRTVAMPQINQMGMPPGASLPGIGPPWGMQQWRS